MYILTYCIGILKVIDSNLSVHCMFRRYHLLLENLLHVLP